MGTSATPGRNHTSEKGTVALTLRTMPTPAHQLAHLACAGESLHHDHLEGPRVDRLEHLQFSALDLRAHSAIGVSWEAGRPP